MGPLKEVTPPAPPYPPDTVPLLPVPAVLEQGKLQGIGRVNIVLLHPSDGTSEHLLSNERVGMMEPLMQKGSARPYCILFVTSGADPGRLV